MQPEVVVAVCSLLGTLAGSLAGIIEQLEEKVKKHNNLIERMVVVEQSTRSAHHRIDSLEELEREVQNGKSN